MKQPFQFVWVLGSGSKWDDNEIRYSIRSVLKHHPDAEITIVGECPEWHTGEDHVFVPDADPCPYVNQWRKLEHACLMYDEFIYMDDDFYLLEPLEAVHYRFGTLAEYMKNLKSTAHWGKVVRATFELLPGADRHLLHVPLPILSRNFLDIANRHPQRLKAPSLVPRQIYCHHETAFEMRDIPQKVKTRRFYRVEGMPFFSTGNNVNLIKHHLRNLYRKPSKYERTPPRR